MNNKIIAVILSVSLSGCFLYPADIKKANKLCGEFEHIRASALGDQVMVLCKDGSRVTFDSSQGK